MTEFQKGALNPERPKNSDFGDYAVNVSSLARFARIAPPQIANSILEYIDKDDNEYTVIGGFINFKAGKKYYLVSLGKFLRLKRILESLKMLKLKKLSLNMFLLTPLALSILVMAVGQLWARFLLIF